MHRFLGIAFFVIFTLSSGCASKLKKPFLWEIEKNGKTSTLFGTQHVGVAYDALPDSVVDRLDRARAVYPETQILEKDLQSRASQMLLAPPDDKFISEIFDPKEYARLKELVGCQDCDLDYRSPLALSIEIASKHDKFSGEVNAYQANQWRPEWGLDRWLNERAHNRGAILGELETLDTPRKCLNLIAVESLRNRLASGAPTEVIITQDFLNADDYRSGDLATVSKGIHELSPAALKCLLTDRNLTWAPKIDEVHNAFAPVFFMVGVAHMAPSHPENILTLLEKRGFKIRRIGQ